MDHHPKELKTNVDNPVAASLTEEGLLAGAMSRKLTHAGPKSANRRISYAGPMLRGEAILSPGQSLAAAVGAAAAELGIRAGMVELSGARLDPAHYVMPTYARSSEHVAYYSDTYSPAAGLTLDFATATFGFRDGAPFLHCHALWLDDQGLRRGGHILPLDTTLAAPLEVRLAGTAAIEMRAEFDPETNFTLFQPFAVAPTDGTCLVAHIRPNEDLVTAIERIARDHGVTQGRILSGIGSTVGAVFEDGTVVEDIPTELLVTKGLIASGRDGKPVVEIDMALIDAVGSLHHGRPARGLNPVLICAEIFIEIQARA